MSARASAGTVLETVEERCKKRETRIVFPEGEDDRIVQAAVVLAREGITSPVLLGDRSRIEEVTSEYELDVSGIEVIDPKTSEMRDAYARAYRKRRDVTEETAHKIVGNELIFGALAVRSGEADGMVGGCVRTSGELIAAGEEVIGLRADTTVPSSVFIMEFANGDVLVFADAALNENPTAEELADIAVSTAASTKALLDRDPRIALLSFSTKGSASHPDVEKVQTATDLARERTGEALIDGELQADAALNEAIAARKLGDDVGAVAGRANTLIFPDLDAGNIAYKLCQELAGASAYGPILQGFEKPISDLSRGASVDDIVGAASITASLVADGGPPGDDQP